jgi:hypothetical protein
MTVSKWLSWGGYAWVNFWEYTDGVQQWSLLRHDVVFQEEA